MMSFRMAAGPEAGRPPGRGYLTAPVNPQAGGPTAVAGTTGQYPRRPGGAAPGYPTNTGTQLAG